jgi:hypothetical protein
MKTALIWIVAAGMACALTAMLVSQRSQARHAAELAAQQAAWQQEKAELEAALGNAKGAERVVVAPGAPAPVAVASIPARTTPNEIVARLRALKPGPTSRMARQAIHDFEELIAAGPAALPAIREFLARNEDIDFPPASGKVLRGNTPTIFCRPRLLDCSMS